MNLIKHYPSPCGDGVSIHFRQMDFTFAIGKCEGICAALLYVLDIRAPMAHNGARLLCLDASAEGASEFF